MEEGCPNIARRRKLKAYNHQPLPRICDNALITKSSVRHRSRGVQDKLDSILLQTKPQCKKKMGRYDNLWFLRAKEKRTWNRRLGTRSMSIVRTHEVKPS